MGGRIADAFVYNLPFDNDPWDKIDWDWKATDEPTARVNIQYTFVKPEIDATIDDINSTVKEEWLGNIAVTKLPEDADYRAIEVQPITWFNLDLTKMVNNVAVDPAETISTLDGLNTKTENKFTVRFISPLKTLIANGGSLDKNNTTIDQTLDIMNTIVVKDKKEVVLYEKKAFKNIVVAADGTEKAADHVYAIGTPTFEWGDEHSKTFAAEMEQRGGKCSIGADGVITFHATGEVGAVNLKVKVSMDCPWRKLETIVTVSIK